MVNTCGDSAPVVENGARPVFVDGTADRGAVAGERLVDGVIDDFLHKVMQSPLVRRTDVHARAFTDRFQPLQNLNLLFSVFTLYLICHS